MLRPFGAKFLINSGEYIKLYKNNLPNNDGLFQNTDTKKIKDFLFDNNINLQKFTSDKFSELDISRFLYLDFLKNNFKNFDFKWLDYAYLGREKSINAISNSDDKACLQNLLLLGNLDKNGEQWWQDLSIFSRSISNDAKQETGREGEDIVYRYERDRLGENADIKKMFIEDNAAGYDLLSFTNSDLKQRLHIEVKTSKSSSGKAFITKNELNKAKIYQEYYRFYFADLDKSKLAIVSYDQIKPHISKDQGSGKTETLSLPLNLFSDLYQPL